LVEQRIRNAKVGSSTLLTGTKHDKGWQAVACQPFRFSDARIRRYQLAQAGTTRHQVDQVFDQAFKPTQLPVHDSQGLAIRSDTAAWRCST
jgi:hypothetical protein